MDMKCLKSKDGSLRDEGRKTFYNFSPLKSSLEKPFFECTESPMKDVHVQTMKSAFKKDEETQFNSPKKSDLDDILTSPI